MKLTAHIHLVPSFRMSGAMLLLPSYSFVAGTWELCFLRRVRIIAKRHITFMSVRLSIPTSTVPNGRIFLKFDIEGFYENLLRKPKFSYNRAKLSGTLHKDPSTFYRSHRHKIAKKVPSSSEMIRDC